MKFNQRSQRGRAARTGPSISLFPFLAVLICTMGALVPLLLAMTRTARLQAEAAALAKATEEAAQHSAKLQTAREDVLWRIEKLKKSRAHIQSQLADSRLELGHLEDHSRRLQGELERYKNTIADLENVESGDRQKQGQTAAELQQLREQVAAAQQRLSDAQKAAAGRNRSYAVVPYEGPNQTRRRPIYLECRADAVVLQPEGIALSESDFEGPMGAGNPLASALRAAREHLLAVKQFDPQAGEPYPMLLVRPEGIGAYYAAREALKSWGCDFGYELVGDDWKFAYPKPDSRLADVVRESLASARVTQARLIAAAPREYAKRKKPVYVASRNGGFVATEGGSGEDDGRTYHRATPAGYRPHGRGTGSGTGSGGSGGSGRYADTSSRNGSGTGNGNYGEPGSEYNPYVAAPRHTGNAAPNVGGAGAPLGGAASDGGPALTAPAGNTYAGAQSDGGTGTGGPGMGGTGSGGSPGAGDSFANGNGGPGANADGGMSPNGTLPGNSGGTGVGGPGAVAGGGSGSGGYAGGGTPSDGTTPGDGGPGGVASGNGGPGGMASGGSYCPGRGGAGNGGSANPYVTTPETMGTATPGNTSGMPGGASSTAANQPNGAQNNGVIVERPEGYVVGQPQRERPTPTPTNSDSDAPPSGEMAKVRLMRPGEWEPTPEPPPKMPEKKDDPFEKKKHREPPKSLAERRGEDWGLRDAARGSVGIARPLRIECYADRLVVVSDRNPANNKVVPLGPRTAASIDTFISEVWVQIEGWGIAGRGMYWRPVLQVAVAPDAEDRYDDLAALLDGSGMTVKRR